MSINMADVKEIINNKSFTLYKKKVYFTNSSVVYKGTSTPCPVEITIYSNTILTTSITPSNFYQYLKDCGYKRVNNESTYFLTVDNPYDFTYNNGTYDCVFSEFQSQSDNFPITMWFSVPNAAIKGVWTNWTVTEDPWQEIGSSYTEFTYEYKRYLTNTAGSQTTFIISKNYITNEEYIANYCINGVSYPNVTIVSVSENTYTLSNQEVITTNINYSSTINLKLEITKIQDILGNILWQKPGVSPYLIYIGDGNYYKFDMVNKTATQLTVTGGFSGAVGSKVFAWKPDAGYLSYWSGSTIKDLDIDLDNNTLTFTDHVAGWYTDSAYDSNHTYSLPGNMTGYRNKARIARNNTGINRSFIVVAGNNYTSPGTLYLNNILQDRTFQLAGNTAIKIGNDMYICKTDTADSSYPYLYKFVSSNGTIDYFETSTIPVNPLGNFSTTQNPWAFWTANGRLFWDQDGYHYEYNFNTGQWQSHTWNGFTGSFKGSRVFKWNNRIFMLGGNSTDNKIYELNTVTDTWSIYWSGLPRLSMRGDYLIDVKGRIGAGANCAPRLA